MVYLQTRLKGSNVDKRDRRMISVQVAMVIVGPEYPDILKSFIAKMLKISKK